MKRCAIYARVSTTDQSVEMQLDALRQYAKDHGWIVYKEYTDVGVSGYTEKREEFQQLMQDATRRSFDVILVWKFDRFARSSKMLLDALEDFRVLNIDFVSFTEAIDTSSPVGKVVFTLVGAIAEFEREIIRERVKSGMARAKRHGKKLGRPRIDTGMLEEIWRLRGTGMSMGKIAKEMDLSSGTVHKYLSP